MYLRESLIKNDKNTISISCIRIKTVAFKRKELKILLRRFSLQYLRYLLQKNKKKRTTYKFFIILFVLEKIILYEALVAVKKYSNRDIIPRDRNNFARYRYRVTCKYSRMMNKTSGSQVVSIFFLFPPSWFAAGYPLLYIEGLIIPILRREQATKIKRENKGQV